MLLGEQLDEEKDAERNEKSRNEIVDEIKTFLNGRK